MTSSSIPLNADVLEEILSHFSVDVDDPDAYWVENKRSLFYIALVGKQFKEPALNALWKSLDSLHPLLRLLPQFRQLEGEYLLYGHWSAHSRRPHSLVDSTPDPLQSVHIQRFDYYARKVREFKYQYSASQILRTNPTVYSSIVKVRQSILPLLRSLYIDLRLHDASSSRDLEHFVPMLVEQTLQKVEIRNPDSMNISPLLSALRFCSKDILSLSISGPISDIGLDLCASFKGLRRVHFTPSTATHIPFLKKLASLQNLEELHLDLTKCTHHSPGEEFLHFTALKRLVLHGNPDFVINATFFIRSKALSSLQLNLNCRFCRDNTRRSAATFGNPPTGYHMKWESMLALTTVISQRWTQSMESLHVNLGCKLVNGVCNPEGIVTSLTALTRLRSLQLTDEYGNTSSMISPTIQRKFETKFTQLEELRLPRASAASISEIHSLVSHLPNLRTLGIKISLNKMPPCDALPPLLHSLSTLSVGHSDAIHERDQAKLMAVSRHLYRMFPYLKEIEYDQAPSWERVSKMLSFIRIVVTDHAELPIIRREKAEAKRRRSSTIREWYNWMVKG